MATLVMDPQIEEELLADRRARRADRFDEVWDGVYVMAPLANNEHQELMINLAAAIRAALETFPDARVFPGINVSDRKKNWKSDYRCPDIAVVLPNSKAIDCDTFYYGGPDFCTEIISDYDRSREKFEFYSRVGVRELLLIDRNPWRLELYRLQKDRLEPAGVSKLPTQEILASQVLPLTFQLIARPSARPQIELVNPMTGQRWLA